MTFTPPYVEYRKPLFDLTFGTVNQPFRTVILLD